MSENINFSECSINGICSSTNTVSSQCEIVMLYVRQLAFYLLKLKEYGITNDLIRNDVTDILYGLFMHAGYTQEKYSETITKLETFISQSVFLYERYCKEHNIKIDKSIKRLKKIHTVEDFIKADKNIATKNELTPEQRNLHEVMFFLCSSIIIKHIELQRLGVDYKEAYYCVLSLLTTCMDKDFTYESVRTLFNNAVDIYIEVVKLIYATQKKLYGKIRETDVNTSSFEGKSILISGCDMKVLQTILDLTKDTSINIYTHGFEMIVAHTLPVLAKYDHLAGHFSVNKDNYIADFSTFKGPILLSRVYMENVDSLYRGRLFSLDPYVNKGVIKVVDNDLSALIKAASIAPGFKKAHKRDSIHAGFDEKKVLEFTDEVLEKLKEGEYERLY
ncbi:hypothetical protein IJV79_03340, partial [bacterium]|nr:hypothetical protein [bacterium]